MKHSEVNRIIRYTESGAATIVAARDQVRRRLPQHVQPGVIFQ